MKISGAFRTTRQKGFTLLEVMITVIIISTLAAMVVPRYLNSVEKGRSAEARKALGAIRDAELTYYLEYNVFTTSFSQMNLAYPAGVCNTGFYYQYSVSLTGGGAGFLAQAQRCTSGGKAPQGPSGYVFNLTQSGDFGGTQDYM